MQVGVFSLDSRVNVSFVEQGLLGLLHFLVDFAHPFGCSLLDECPQVGVALLVPRLDFLALKRLLARGQEHLRRSLVDVTARGASATSDSSGRMVSAFDLEVDGAAVWTLRELVSACVYFAVLHLSKLVSNTFASFLAEVRGVLGPPRGGF